MPVILAIDAAWTATQPSGVALIATAEGARPLVEQVQSAVRNIDWEGLAMAWEP